MSKNYEEAVEEARVLLHHGEDVSVEHLVAVGYRAGLQDAVRALNEGGHAVQPHQGSARLYAVVRDKIASLARKFEDRARELKV